MTPHLEQRLAEIAAEKGYHPASEYMAALRTGAVAAIESAIEYVESSAKKVTYKDHKVGMYVAAVLMHLLLPPPPKEPSDERD